jgi:hypothetical protein
MVSDQLHDLAALLPRKESVASISPRTGLEVQRKEKLLPLPEKNHDSNPSHSLAESLHQLGPHSSSVRVLYSHLLNGF